MAYTDKEMKEAWDSLENSYRNQYYNNDYNAFASAVRTNEKNREGYGYSSMSQGESLNLSDEDYGHMINMIQRGEDINWIEPWFAEMIGQRAFTSGDTASFKVLKSNFPTIKKPPPIVSSPREIVSEMLTKKEVPVGDEFKLPGHLVSLQDYTDDKIESIANISGTGPLEGLPFMTSHIPSTDWWQEAINHIEISPHSKYYEKFKGKKIKPFDDTQRNLMGIARGKKEATHFVKGKYGVIPASPGVSPKQLPISTIKLTASDGKTGFTEEIPIEDIVINQEKFFRQFSGLGAPTKKGEVKISPRSDSFAHRLLFGARHPMQEPRGNKFVTLEKEDGSLFWAPVPKNANFQGN